MTTIKKLIKNTHGAILSLEFAGVFFGFVLVLCVAYDIYNSIMLQNKLDRTVYSVASLFRERTALYPSLDDSTGSLPLSLCQKEPKACFDNRELFNAQQVTTLQKLASKLMGKDVAIRVDGLFIMQDVNNPGAVNLDKARLIDLNVSSCDDGSCRSDIKSYFDALPDMKDTSDPEHNYTKLVPFVPRQISVTYPYSGVNGRWIPLYRINLCIINEESLYLKFSNRTRLDSNILPNLCSEATVLSRCNDLDDPSTQCPIYVY